MNKYYKFSDGWFTYYVNVATGEKKFSLDKDDVLVESNLDDFVEESWRWNDGIQAFDN